MKTWPRGYSFATRRPQHWPSPTSSVHRNQGRAPPRWHTGVNDLDHYLAFPPGERCEARPERTQGLFILAPSTIASEAEVDRVDQEIRSTGIPRGLPAE